MRRKDREWNSPEDAAGLFEGVDRFPLGSGKIGNMAFSPPPIYFE
jgi:hypothetical protein